MHPFDDRDELRAALEASGATVIPLTLDEVAGDRGRRGRRRRRVGRASTGPAFLDSRAPEPGGLFVAFAGEHVDGHDFAAGAVEGGAAARARHRAPPACPPCSSPTRRPPCRSWPGRCCAGCGRRDAGPARSSRSPARRARPPPRTCWPGCSPTPAPTVATAGSFNNELGLPLTVLRATGETRYLVLEMGARGIGHLAELCEIAPPDISLVLNVGKAHIGEFGSQENDRAGQGRARRGARRPTAHAVLNADDPLVAAMADADRGPGRGPSAGPATPTSASATSRSTTSGAPSFDLTHGGTDRARRAAPARRAPGHQRRGHGRDRAGGRPPAGRGRREPARDRPALAVADGGPRARRRAGRAQRRLQRQPRLDGVRAGDARPDGGARRPAHGRGAGRDARARRQRRARSTARSARSRTGWASTRSWSSGTGARAIHDAARRGARRATARRATSRPSNEAGGVVARECGRPRRRPGQGVPGRAARTGRRHAPGDDRSNDQGEEPGR